MQKYEKNRMKEPNSPILVGKREVHWKIRCGFGTKLGRNWDGVKYIILSISEL